MARSSISRTNGARAEHGLTPYAWDDCAALYAQEHARNMAEGAPFEHQSLQSVGQGCGGYLVGENIGWTSRTDPEERIFALWMDSPGHRDNILQPHYTHLGVGAARGREGKTFMVQVFVGR